MPRFMGSPWGWGCPWDCGNPTGLAGPHGAEGSPRDWGSPRRCRCPWGWGFLQVCGNLKGLWDRCRAAGVRGAEDVRGAVGACGAVGAWRSCLLGGCARGAVSTFGTLRLQVPVGVCGGPAGLQIGLWVPVGLSAGEALGRPVSPALERDRVAGVQRSGLPSSFSKAAESPQNVQGNVLGGCGQEGVAEVQIGVPLPESRWAQGPCCR